MYPCVINGRVFVSATESVLIPAGFAVESSVNRPGSLQIRHPGKCRALLSLHPGEGVERAYGAFRLAFMAWTVLSQSALSGQHVSFWHDDGGLFFSDGSILQYPPEVYFGTTNVSNVFRVSVKHSIRERIGGPESCPFSTRATPEQVQTIIDWLLGKQS